MAENNLVTLVDMKAGTKGVVSEVRGGHVARERLSALNVRTGKKVEKVSAMVMNGPVTISIDGKHIAMGRGMAAKVIIQLGDRTEKNA